MQKSTMIKIIGLGCLVAGSVQAYRITNANTITRAMGIDGDNADTQSARNIAAFLWMIRNCEGTASADGYNTLFGYEYFTDFSSHPNRKICKSGICSTAAGAYQILYSTWILCRANVSGLNDFSPANQDKAATWLLKRRGVLHLVEAGQVEEAINGNGKKGNGARWEWASLPNSPYGQPVRTLAQAKSYYETAGGIWV